MMQTAPRFLRPALVVAVVVVVATGWVPGSRDAWKPLPAAIDQQPPAAAAADPTGESRAIAALYSDSLGFEAAHVVAGGLAVQARLDRSTMPGAALCDLVGLLRQEPGRAPDVAIIQYSGNTLTGCMRGDDGQLLERPAVIDKYEADAQLAITMLRTRGARVFVALSPRSAADDLATDLNHMYATVVDAWAARGEPVSLIDSAAPLLAPDGSFTERLPCLDLERQAGGCGPDGTISVRSADGTHFCPEVTGGFVLCPTWSSGAYRFGTAIASAVRHELMTSAGG